MLYEVKVQMPRIERGYGSVLITSGLGIIAGFETVVLNHFFCRNSKSYLWDW